MRKNSNYTQLSHRRKMQNKAESSTETAVPSGTSAGKRETPESSQRLPTSAKAGMVWYWKGNIFFQWKPYKKQLNIAEVYTLHTKTCQNLRIMSLMLMKMVLASGRGWHRSFLLKTIIRWGHPVRAPAF